MIECPDGLIVIIMENLVRERQRGEVRSRVWGIVSWGAIISAHYAKH